LRASAIALATALALAACGGGGGTDPSKLKQTLRPQFAPTSTSTAATDSSTSSTTIAGSSSTAAGTPPSTTAPLAAAPTAAAIVDRAGDVTPSPLDRPPAWADLLGARLTRRADGFELRVRLAGGSAPSSTDEAHTMNVASFYDLDGDGRVDFEVWANLASRGWGSSYFDDVHGSGDFQERSGVTVTTEGDEVVLRFPLTHLQRATRFRWSIASEWGRYEVLGTAASARDDAPDDDAAADFPAP
jgi:hypothetical protein